MKKICEISACILSIILFISIITMFVTSISGYGLFFGLIFSCIFIGWPVMGIYIMYLLILESLGKIKMKDNWIENIMKTIG